jgi:Terminase RNaseH-like domain
LAVERFLGEAGTNRVLYAVPTAEQIQRFWHEVCNALAEPLEFGVFKKYEADKIIEYPGTEQRIRAKTAWNANTLRGDYGDLIILDEFQLMAEDCLQDVVYPMLIDNNGDLVLVYTPPSLKSRAVSKATDKRHAAKLFKEKKNDPRWLCLHFTSHDNPHLSKEGIAEVSADMTQVSILQEIMAEDSEEVPGALWKQRMIDDLRVSEYPPLIRIVVGVDPSGGSETEVGIVAAGLGANGHGYVLADKSKATPTPREWASETTWTYYELKADRILGEENFGGQMVETTLKMHDENISYKAVRATRGKLVRAEPICALYEKGMIHHVGNFPLLEEEMCSYVPGGKSPNRMDALVWCFTDLFPERVRLTLAESIITQAEERQQAAEVDKVQKENLGKVVTVDNTKKCRECGSPLLVKRGPITHCNSCGAEFGQSPAPATGGRQQVMK